jgi:hypothetical protein
VVVLEATFATISYLIERRAFSRRAVPCVKQSLVTVSAWNRTGWALPQTVNGAWR